MENHFIIPPIANERNSMDDDGMAVKLSIIIE